MNRLLLLTVLVIGALSASGVASADHGDVTRPLCADIVTASFGYSASNVVTVGIRTAEPSCKSITYSLHVIVDPGDPNTEIVSVSSRGGDDGDPNTPADLLVLRTGTISDPDESPSVVCAYVTTSRGGPDGTAHPFDRAPDGDACVSLTAGGSPGDVGHA